MEHMVLKINTECTRKNTQVDWNFNDTLGHSWWNREKKHLKLA